MAPAKPVPRLKNAIPSLALAKQLEAAYECCLLRYTQSLARYRPDAGATMQAIAGGQMIFSGPSPFSVAVGVALDRAITPAEFHQIEEFFCHRKIRSAIEVCPYSHPSLLELLQKHGYRVGDVSTVLCRDLAWASPVPNPSGPGVCVRWAEAQEAELWADILIRLFYATDPGPEVRTNLVALFHVPDSLNAMAVMDGQVVGIAGGMLPVGGEVAAFFYSGTLPQYRRRGVHAALLQLRLIRARQHGCSLVVVSAIPGSDSERNLLRHGFRQVFQKHTYVKTLSPAP